MLLVRQNFSGRFYFVLAFLIAVVGPVYAGTAVVLQPVSASGAHTIIGSDVFLPAGGQRVKFEVRVAGWGDLMLKTVQVKLDTSGFDNGTSPLSHTVVTCPSYNSAGHSFCAQTFEAGSRCSVGCAPGSTVGCRCESGFQNQMRTDYVGFGLSQVSAVDISAPDYRFGLTTQPPDAVTDPGVALYLGTFFLTVPAGAQGIYVIGTDFDETFLQDDQSVNIPLSLRTDCRIIIGDAVPPGSRYAVFAPEFPGEQTAVRVTLSSLYHPGPPVAAGEDRDFSDFEGQVRWLGPPTTYSDVALNSTFVAAPLQCTPHFRDWGAFESVQVYGDAIIPSSVYKIREVPVACADDPDNPACFGPTQIVHTGQWGDAAAPFARSDQAAQPDAADIAAIVDSFRKLSLGASKALTQLNGLIPHPDCDISYRDVDLAVDAVMGKPYPLPQPSECP